jgi:hypothetical protein
VRRQRWLCPDDAAFTLDAFEERGLFAANIGAGANADLDIE